MFRILEKIARIRWVRKVLVVSKRISLPGFGGVPLYDVGEFFIMELRDDRLMMRAAAVSFYLLLALFPGLIFLFTLIPYFPVENLQELILEQLHTMLPMSAYIFLSDAIKDLLEEQRGGLLSFGFIMAFYFTSTGVEAIMMSFDKRYEVYKRRGFWKKKGAALLLTILLVFVSVGTVVLGIIGDEIIRWLGYRFNFLSGSPVYIALMIMRWVVLVLLCFLIFWLIYRFGPARKKTHLKMITPGTTLATLLSIGASIVFSYYVNNVSMYNKVYGSLGALIATMLWIYINAIILLIGFELNSSILVKNWEHKSRVKPKISKK